MSLFRRMLPGPQRYDALYRGFKWAVPARYNIAREVCDRWADAEPDRLAIIHRVPGAPLERITYGQLRHRANRLANALRAAGIAKGDRVALLLPQTPGLWSPTPPASPR